MGVQNPNSTSYVHPDEPNLLNLHKAMQYNGNGEPEIRTATAINGNIIIDGNVNIPGTITVNSTPEDPVHVHVTEVGTSGILDVPYMPINGNVIVTEGNVTFTNTTIEVTQGTDPWNISGNVNVDTLPAITGNVTVSGNVNVDTLPAITGNVEANVTGGNIIVSGNVNVDTLPAITGNVEANVTGGNIIVSGNVNVDTLPAITGNVTVSGNVNVDTLPAITGNVTVSGNVNVDTLPAITGNVEANVTAFGNIDITGNTLPVTFDNTTIEVTQGTDPWNVTGNVAVTGGSINIIPDVTAGDFYGEPYAIPITPVVQTYGVYGTNVRDHQIYNGGGGSVTSVNSAFKISSTSTIGSYAILRSRRFNTHKAGQTLIARIYSKFDTPAVGTSQRIGVNNQQDSYYIGYNGTTFGVYHIHSGKVPLYRLTVNSFTGSQTVTVTLNGTPYTANIVAAESTNLAAERIAVALKTSASASWLVESVDNSVTFLYTGTLGPLSGTFSATGSSFSGTFTTLQAGATQTVDFYYPGDTYGTVFTLPSGFDNEGFQQWQIKYSWPGANFFVLDQTTGRYVKFYAHYHLGNGVDTPQVSNPAYKVAALAYNTGGSTGVNILVADMMMGLEGITNRNNFPGGAAVNQTSLTQDDTHHIISISNPLVFNNTINTREVLLQDITVSMQCNDPTLMFLYLDATLSTGVHDYQSQDGFSVAVSKVAGLINPNTNFPILSFVVGLTGATTQFALEQYRVVVPPGSTISIAVTSTATIQKAAAGISWYND